MGSVYITYGRLSNATNQTTLTSCRSITAESIPSSSNITTTSSSGSFTCFDGRPLFLAVATDPSSLDLLRRLSLL